MESDLVAMAPWPFKRRSMIFDRQGYQPKVLFLPGECDVIGYLSVVWTSDFIAITKKKRNVDAQCIYHYVPHFQATNVFSSVKLW